MGLSALIPVGLLMQDYEAVFSLQAMIHVPEQYLYRYFGTQIEILLVY